MVSGMIHEGTSAVQLVNRANRHCSGKNGKLGLLLQIDWLSPFRGLVSLRQRRIL